MPDDDKDKTSDNGSRKEIKGLRLRYYSDNINAGINIPPGMFHRLKVWVDEHWKLAIWRSGITTVVLASLLNGVTIRNMTFMDKSRLTALEIKAVDYDSLNADVQILKKRVAGYQEISEDDRKQLEKSQQQERDKKRRRELEEYNRARAEKLRRIGQADELRADPIQPSPGNAPIRN